MIEGLQIDVPAPELKQLLIDRLNYHQHKVEAFEKQLAAFEKLHIGLDEEALAIGKVSNSSPQQGIEQAIKRHRDQCVYYRFVSEHIVPHETYRLAEGDLVRLGIQDRY